jgi:predicted transposase YbfD/YdcC
MVALGTVDARALDRLGWRAALHAGLVRARWPLAVTLGWVSVRHSEEFAEFIRRQSGRRRFLGLTREEVVETCRHCQAREIAGTPY